MPAITRTSLVFFENWSLSHEKAQISGDSEGTFFQIINCGFKRGSFCGKLLSMENKNQQFVPPQPPKSFRMVLDLKKAEKRIDSVLLAALKAQKENLNLAILTRGSFKQLFQDGRILIKGQRARPSSALNKGITYVDILGFTQTHNQ